MPDNKILIMIGGMAFLLPATPFLALAGIGLIVVGCIIYSVIKSFDEQKICKAISLLKEKEQACL